MSEIFNAEERQIFRYWNGKENVWGDPIAIRNRLAIFTDGKLDDVLRDCQSNDPLIRRQANERMVSAIRKAFDMPCNPRAPDKASYGPTQEECVAAMRAFLAFVKKNGRSSVKSPMSSAASAGPPAGN